jgi:Cof subfamily protein (haloacid dehalogenase superfamily)
MASKKEPPEDVRLVVADVDGALVTPDQTVTARARAAVREIIKSGITFTIASARPPRGMKMLIDDLQLEDPIAAFNGGLLVRSDFSVIRGHWLPRDVVQRVIDILTNQRLDVWIYNDRDWFVPSRHGPHVDREEWTVNFPPIVSDFKRTHRPEAPAIHNVPFARYSQAMHLPVQVVPDLLNRVAKIVGVSNDLEAVARCETAVQQKCGKNVSAARSQPHYLDVTHPKANKGEVISALSEMLHVPIANIATIGDMPNDVSMFKHSGVSIAMGNASSDVRHAARFVTSSNEEDGFALAMERFVLRAQVT